MMGEAPLISAVNVTKRFGGLTAVDSVSFCVNPGAIKALIGPNGAGKTTMLNMLSGIIVPTSGRIEIKGHRINGKLPHHIARLGVARTFQMVQLFGNMTVVENVMVGLHSKGRSGIVGGAVRLPSVVREERYMFDRAMERLADVDLESRAFEQATALPFGQQRLLEIARAMASEPDILLLDEPAAGLS
ncbi:MAG: ATP-binding cassette domain-containing protein, partial [Armatimonadota bacterium]|nr:ATP-binding cassette domain-containing protein [Armatimonadota bacterium]